VGKSKGHAAIYEPGAAVEVHFKEKWLPAQYSRDLRAQKKGNVHEVVLEGAAVRVDGRKIRPPTKNAEQEAVEAHDRMMAEVDRKKAIEEIIRRAGMLRLADVHDGADVSECVESVLAGIYHLGDTFGLRGSQRWYTARVLAGSARAEMERDTAAMARDEQTR
jgi:hypothetical protein